METERETDRQTETERDRKRQTDRHTDRQREREIKIDRHTQRLRQRETNIETNRRTDQEVDVGPREDECLDPDVAVDQEVEQQGGLVVPEGGAEGRVQQAVVQLKGRRHLTHPSLLCKDRNKIITYLFIYKAE